MRFCILASGSRGNTMLIESEGMRILIDAGLSARGMVKRLDFIGVAPGTIEAVMISHEHGDHVRGLEVWCKKYNTLVYATAETHSEFPFHARTNMRVEHFKPGHAFEIGRMRISPFTVSHDASDPVGFVIESNGSRLGVATDLGCVTALVKERLKALDALIIESNHDVDMLMSGPYPWHVKDRVKSNHGHLSNAQAARLIAELAHPGLKQIALAHLSEINNLPEFAQTSAEKAASEKCDARVSLGWQHKPGEVISI